MWVAIVIIVIALLMVLAAPKPKIENARAANLGDFNFPRSREGDPLPWFLGTVQHRSPNSLWYGDYTPVPIKKKQNTGLFSSKRVTVGYRYHIGLNLCWGIGGANPVILRKLWSDKHIFFQGTVTTNSTIAVALPTLFGGEANRGGMVGLIDFYTGSMTQTRNSYLAGKADADVPAYIGQCHMVFRGNRLPAVWGSVPVGGTWADGFYFGTTTNINAIKAELSRYSTNIHPTYSIMPNGLDVNPMEVLYAAFTETFGMPGLSTDDIDMPSWLACAQQLYDEEMGMSLLVQQSVTGKDIAEEALRIADGILYQDTDTGKMVAVLIREDYVVENLPVFDQTVVRELTSFNKTTWAQTYNQCRVIFKDRENQYAERAALAQDFANINFQQRVRNTDINVPGCFVNEAANQLAVRQLSLLSVPLFQIEIRCNRKAANLKPGSLFVFNWAPYGIANMVMRVQKINKGTLTDGTVTINAVQDRFATALAVFAPPTGSGWTPIDTNPQPVASRRVFEAPRWFHQFITEPAPANKGMVLALARPPGNVSVDYDVQATLTSDTAWLNATTVVENLAYYGAGALTADYNKAVGAASGYDVTGFTLSSVDVPEDILDSNGTFDPTGPMLLLVGDEIMLAENVTANVDGTYSFSEIRRALLDTDFETHTAGAPVYFIYQADSVLNAFFDDTASWKFRLLDNTPDASLDPNLANTDNLTLTQRATRPAPPDYLTINGSRTPADVLKGATVTLDWRSRNRLTTSIVPYDTASEAAEAGTDYGWRYRIDAGAWSAYTYTSGLTASMPLTNDTQCVYEFEVVSRRDGLLSRIGDKCSVVMYTLYRVTEAGDRRITEDNQPRVTE
jgi:Putative phage tail protein